jgi:hypothetical protein
MLCHIVTRSRQLLLGVHFAAKCCKNASHRSAGPPRCADASILGRRDGDGSCGRGSCADCRQPISRNRAPGAFPRLIGCSSCLIITSHPGPTLLNLLRFLLIDPCEFVSSVASRLRDADCRSSSPQFAPALFRLALHRRRVRVLELEPVAGAAGAVARAQPLGDDALEPELAGVAETTSPSCVRCSFNRRPGRFARSRLASVALRVANGSRRRSSPSSSKRSKA